jgi:hypothetical protein
MNEGKGLRSGGYISGGVLIVFGIAVIALGVWGFNFTRDHIKREGSASGRLKTLGRGACSRAQPGTSRPPLCQRGGRGPPARAPRVAFTDDRVWSIHGTERAQPVATGRKWDGSENGPNKPKPLPWVATGCRWERMVGRTPSQNRRGSPLWLPQEAPSPANPKAHRT